MVTGPKRPSVPPMLCGQTQPVRHPLGWAASPRSLLEQLHALCDIPVAPWRMTLGLQAPRWGFLPAGSHPLDTCHFRPRQACSPRIARQKPRIFIADQLNSREEIVNFGGRLDNRQGVMACPSQNACLAARVVAGRVVMSGLCWCITEFQPEADARGSTPGTFCEAGQPPFLGGPRPARAAPSLCGGAIVQARNGSHDGRPPRSACSRVISNRKPCLGNCSQPWRWFLTATMGKVAPAWAGDFVHVAADVQGEFPQARPGRAGSPTPCPRANRPPTPQKHVRRPWLGVAQLVGPHDQNDVEKAPEATPNSAFSNGIIACGRKSFSTRVTGRSGKPE